MKRKLVKKTVMVAGCLLMLSMCACGKTIDLNDYVTVEIEGYEGYGTARAVFDDEKFEEDYSKMQFKGDDDGLYKMFYNSAADCVTGEFIDVDVDVASGLSNGDKVKLKWRCNEGSIKEMTGYSVKFEESDTIVEGLEAVPTFDGFAGVEVQFSGFGPDGTATVITDSVSEQVGKLRFELDKADGLSNGDVVKLRISNVSEENADYCVELCGAVPETFEKEFVVEGLASYVSSLDQISDELMEKMDKQARDGLQAYVAQNWVDAEGLKNMELLGHYFLSRKAGYTGSFNGVYLVYRVTASNDECEEGFDYYYYALYKDIILLADGTCSVDLSAVELPDGGANIWGDRVYGEAFIKGEYWYKGYEDLDTMFNKKVIAEIDEYDYVSTVEE